MKNIFRIQKPLILIVCFLWCMVPFLGQADTKKIAAWFASSFQHEIRADYRAALKDVLKILKAKPDHYIANLRAGWLYYLQGKYAESVVHYRKTTKLAPSAIEPRLGLMMPLMAMKDWKSTEITALEVLQTDNRNYLSVSRLAYVLFQQGRYTDAAKAYARLVDWYPGELDMKLGLAWSYLKMGKYKTAETLFREVLAVRKTDTGALSGLDMIEIRRN